MSNVFSNSSFAVLSVMKTLVGDDRTYGGSTVFLQRKPEEDYGNITILSFSQEAYGTSHSLRVEDFDNQDAFEANVVPVLHSAITDFSSANVILSNSNISVNSYSANGTAIPN
jgi:hypothetical protein